MGFRHTERLEYIKQPHVIALVLAAVAVLSVAGITASQRIANMRRIVQLDTEQACLEFIDDTDLCKFAAVSEQDGERSHRITTTETTSTGTEVTTTDIESPERMSSITKDGSGSEISAYTVIDADTYVKDYADGVWAMYTDPEYVAADTDDLSYDFTSAASPDVVDFRDNYKKIGSESCGDLTCFKYEIVSPEQSGSTVYLWFDSQDYLTRRYMIVTDDSTSNSQVSYLAISISPPSATKPVSEAELEEYL